MQYWHMPIHPDDKTFAIERTRAILVNNKIIGVGQWSAGQAQLMTLTTVCK